MRRFSIISAAGSALALAAMAARSDVVMADGRHMDIKTGRDDRGPDPVQQASYGPGPRFKRWGQGKRRVGTYKGSAAAKKASRKAKGPKPRPKRPPAFPLGHNYQYPGQQQPFYYAINHYPVALAKKEAMFHDDVMDAMFADWGPKERVKPTFESPPCVHHTKPEIDR